MNGFTSFLKATHYDKQDVKRIKVFFLLMIHHLVMNIIILQVDLDILCHLVEFQVNLSTRIVPGALPRVIVVQEAESLHATWVIFDRFYLCLSLPPSGTCINFFCLTMFSSYICFLQVEHDQVPPVRSRFAI
jgi:hypothetical protein